jgi:hypothetical protein
MNRDDEPAIEVEVIEIDGVVPPPKSAAADGSYPDDESANSQTWTHWQSWPSQARNLHPLWWPVLIVAGGILLAVFLTAGLLLGVLFVIYRIVRDLLRALFG